MEILRQHPGALDAVFVPVGGGGLLAGVAAYIKYVRPQVRVIGPSVAQFHIEFNLPSGATCIPRVYIDGRPGALHELYAFAPDQIAGVEFYTRASTIPLRFQDVMNPCGVVVLWTKTLQ